MSSRLRFWSGVIAGLVLLVFMAACAPGGGSATGAGHTNGGGATATPSAPGSPMLNGCPAKQPPADLAGHPADVIVTQGGGVNSPPVDVKVGQILEIRLPANVRWKLDIRDPNAILTKNEATGWYDASLKACRWRFTVVKAGQAALLFSGGLVCLPGKACPAIASMAEFTIVAQSA